MVLQLNFLDVRKLPFKGIDGAGQTVCKCLCAENRAFFRDTSHAHLHRDLACLSRLPPNARRVGGKYFGAVDVFFVLLRLEAKNLILMSTIPNSFTLLSLFVISGFSCALKTQFSASSAEIMKVLRFSAPIQRPRNFLQLRRLTKRLKKGERKSVSASSVLCDHCTFAPKRRKTRRSRAVCSEKAQKRLVWEAFSRHKKSKAKHESFW